MRRDGADEASQASSFAPASRQWETPTAPATTLSGLTWRSTAMRRGLGRCYQLRQWTWTRNNARLGHQAASVAHPPRQHPGRDLGQAGRGGPHIRLSLLWFCWRARRAAGARGSCWGLRAARSRRGGWRGASTSRAAVKEEVAFHRHPKHWHAGRTALWRFPGRAGVRTPARCASWVVGAKARRSATGAMGRRP